MTSPPTAAPPSRRGPTRPARTARCCGCAMLADRFDLDALDVELLLVAHGARRRRPLRALLRLPQRRRDPPPGERRPGPRPGRRLRPPTRRPAAGFDAGSRARRRAGLLEIDDPDRPFLTRGAARARPRHRPRPRRRRARRRAGVRARSTSQPTARARRSSRSRARSPTATRSSTCTTASRRAVQRGRRRCGAAGCRRSCVDLVRVAATGDAERIIARPPVREARLRGGVLIAGPVDALADGRPSALVQTLTGSPVPLVLTGHRGWEPSLGRPAAVHPRGRHGLPAPRPRPAVGGRARGALPTASTPPRVTAQYRLGAGQIRRAAEAAVGRRAARRSPLAEADVRLGARQQNAARLERLARRIEPACRWDDLVLPAARRRRTARPHRPGPAPRAGARRVADAPRRRPRARGSPRCSPATPAPARR